MRMKKTMTRGSGLSALVRMRKTMTRGSHGLASGYSKKAEVEGGFSGSLPLKARARATQALLGSYFCHWLECS